MAGLAGSATTPKRIRLALALTVSGVVLNATSAGPWAFWLCALLAVVPALVAMRCLPAWLGVVVAVVPGVVGRAIAFRFEVPAQGLGLAMLIATAALVPALVVDRFVWLRFPRATLLGWPALVVITSVVVEHTAGPEIASYVAPLPDITALTVLPSVLPQWAPLFVAMLVAQGIAAAATQFNMPIDPLPRAIRERGVRWCLLFGFAFAFAMGVVALVW